jgi:hypothetical protein
MKLHDFDENLNVPQPGGGRAGRARSNGGAE